MQSYRNAGQSVAEYMTVAESTNRCTLLGNYLMFKFLYLRLQRNVEIQFHVARSLTWVAVGFRMLKDSAAGLHYSAAAIVFTGALTTLIPAAAHFWNNKRQYVKYRPIFIIVDNMLQMVLGCFTHMHIYREEAGSWRDVSPWRAAAVLLTGNGVAWLCMSALLGCLVFRYAMVMQATLTMILLLASPGMCAQSFSLQRAYMALHLATVRNANRFLPKALVRMVPLLTLPTTANGGADDAAFALAVCQTYQPLMLLSLGLIAPTWSLYWREIKSRESFARTTARNVPHVTAVRLNPPPAMIQYWAFAAPAVAALYFYVAKVL